MMDKEKQLIGHRFSAWKVPENTLAACEYAAQSGLKWVEFDVMLARCGTPIVFHDVNLRRLTGVTGRIRHMTYQQLKQLTVKSPDGLVRDAIPSLSDVLALCAKRNLHINLEIKPLRGQETKTARIAWQTVQNLWPQDKEPPLYSSFSLQSLRVVRYNDASARLGLIMDRWRRGKILRARQLSCQSLHCHKRIITPKRIQYLHEVGLKVLVYSINDAKKAHDLWQQGADGLFTDDRRLIS